MSGIVNDLPGHCLTAAQRLRRDADRIAVRLAQAQPVKALAAEYGVNVMTFRKHVEGAIGPERWRQIVKHRGPQKGQIYEPREYVKAETPEIDAGPHCYHCTGPIEPDTLVCKYCGTLLQG